MFGPPRDARYRRPQQRLWDPLLARVYGIKPCDMGSLTVREYRLFVDDLQRFGIGGVGLGT